MVGCVGMKLWARGVPATASSRCMHKTGPPAALFISAPPTAAAAAAARPACLPACLQEVNGGVAWKHSVAIRQPWTKVEGWILPELPPLITDILVSLDDK